MLQNQGVTWRSVLIGALLIPPNAYWLLQLEMTWGGTYPSVLTLLLNAVFSLMLVIGLNLIVKRSFPKSALSYGELLIIYVMLAEGMSLCGCDVVQTLTHIIVTPYRYATSENEWAEIFHPYLPKYFTLPDKDISRGFFEGGSSFWNIKYIRAWMVPIALWMGFIVLLIWTMFCINAILRKQWVERERLAYPIVRLPQEMARGDGVKGILRSKTMWIGFTIAAGINLINGITYLYPAIPYIPVKHQWIFHFTEKPWDAVGWMPVAFYPFVLGIGFLMPLDLSFSCWFFYLVWKAERVIGSAAGIGMQGYPFYGEQTSGVWMGILVFTIWVSRNHLKHVLSAAFGKMSREENEKEPLPYKLALLGGVAGLGLLIALCNQMGMSVWMALAYFIIYFALGATLTRIRAELGPPVHNLYLSGPDYIITRVTGTRILGPRNLTAMTLLYWINAESYRSSSMPHQMEGMKLAEGGQFNIHRLVIAILVGAFVGGLSCFISALQFGYSLGSDVKFGGPARWFSIGGYNRLAWWLSYPQNTDWTGLGASAFGFVFSLVLLIMRMRFFWWPVHPIGYAIAYSWDMNLLWFPILISFITKMIVLRYGGLSLYRRAIPLFLGFILGEYMMGGTWSILGILLGRPMYAFWI
ncbi:MAG: DUF6785 family protein [Candidatus Poribacteria bacterium]